MTGCTLFFIVDLNFLLTAEYSLFKGNANRGSHIGTTHRAIILAAAAASSATEDISEDISEDVSHVGSVEIKTTESTGTAACAALECSMTELVILSSLLRVT